MLHSNISCGENGNLHFAGLDTVALAKKYGTPLMLIDEDRIRHRCRTYVNAMKHHFGGDSRPLLASKALCLGRLYRIAHEEGMFTDIVSPGELYAAKKAHFPLENAFFHGNNKTDEDIEFAIDSNIGYFVADNREEAEKINSYAKKRGKIQKVLLRLSPGIDPHTHAKISTGSVDSKFGSAIETGAAEKMTLALLEMDNIKLCGYHCHIGSQIFDTTPFCDAAEIMLCFMAQMRDAHGYRAQILNLGGGFGVRYTEDDPQIDYEEKIEHIAECVKAECKRLGIPVPIILMEPGRSIVADSGMTLYTVGSVKKIPGYKTYVSVDGGMSDNPRYTLYCSRYTACIANKAAKEKNTRVSVSGRLCESGDLLGEDMPLQKAQKGDILAFFVTGAYNYSMASNYNKIPRPPVVFLSEGTDTLVARRETYEDMMCLEI